MDRSAAVGQLRRCPGFQWKHTTATKQIGRDFLKPLARIPPTVVIFAASHLERLRGCMPLLPLLFESNDIDGSP